MDLGYPMSKAEPWCAGWMDRSEGEKPKARPTGLFQARGGGKPPVAHRRGPPISKAEPWCAGRVFPLRRGRKVGVISPLRRRVPFPTAEKVPKRRLETKVSNAFLSRLRGSPIFHGASGYETTQNCAATACLVVVTAVASPLGAPAWAIPRRLSVGALLTS